MRAILKYSLVAVMMALLAGVTTSCVYDNLADEPDCSGGSPAGETMLVIRMNLPVMAETRAGGGTYEPGTGYENYINTTSDGLRIYLFGSDNKFILRFIPMLVSQQGGGSSVTYTAVGRLTPEMESLTDFKVVVLANWPVWSDGTLVPGVTTIGDLCNDETAQFSSFTRHELNPDEGRTIPFYGVHEYSGVTFEKGTRNTLDEPVALLRAMAKVEVVFDNPGLSFDDVILHGVNSKGYCAPEGVYSQAAYDHDGNWNEDYVRTLHLAGGANDADATSNVTHLLRTQQADGTQKETWVCYVPEYRNTSGSGPAADRAWLELRLDIPDITLENVYFVDYDSSNRPVANTDFDLHRNNLYRFNVSLGKGGLIIRVLKWENTYDNNYTFE